MLCGIADGYWKKDRCLQCICQIYKELTEGCQILMQVLPTLLQIIIIKCYNRSGRIHDRTIMKGCGFFSTIPYLV